MAETDRSKPEVQNKPEGVRLPLAKAGRIPIRFVDRRLVHDLVRSFNRTASHAQ